MSRLYIILLAIGAMVVVSICQQDLAKWTQKNKKILSPIEGAKEDIMKR